MPLINTIPCPQCKKSSLIAMPQAAYDAWRGGTVLQRAWPQANKDIREQLITGIHPECWDAYMGPDPDEE